MQVESDSRALAILLRRLWSGFPSSRPDGPLRHYAVELKGSDGPKYEGPNGVRRLDPHEPLLHGYNLIVSDLLGSVGDHFVLHASTVVRDGAAVLLSGPSTFGKTTLAVHLARRGFSLLAEDVTFLERSSGRAVPFGRVLHLRSGTRGTLTPEDLEAASQAAEDIHSEEWSVAPGPWLSVASDPALPGVVVILRPREDGTGIRRFPIYEVRAVAGSEGSLEEIPELFGVRGVERVEGVPGRIRIFVDHAAALMAWLDDRREDIVSVAKLPSSSPDFDGPPRLEPIGRFQAALELAQEMMNRHTGSHLEEGFRGRWTELAIELALALRAAHCYALLPGRLEETLDLLNTAFEKRAS